MRNLKLISCLVILFWCLPAFGETIFDNFSAGPPSTISASQGFKTWFNFSPDIVGGSRYLYVSHFLDNQVATTATVHDNLLTVTGRGDGLGNQGNSVACSYSGFDIDLTNLGDRFFINLAQPTTGEYVDWCVMLHSGDLYAETYGTINTASTYTLPFSNYPTSMLQHATGLDLKFNFTGGPPFDTTLGSTATIDCWGAIPEPSTLIMLVIVFCLGTYRKFIKNINVSTIS